MRLFFRSAFFFSPLVVSSWNSREYLQAYNLALTFCRNSAESVCDCFYVFLSLSLSVFVNCGRIFFYSETSPSICFLWWSIKRARWDPWQPFFRDMFSVLNCFYFKLTSTKKHSVWMLSLNKGRVMLINFCKHRGKFYWQTTILGRQLLKQRHVMCKALVLCVPVTDPIPTL